MYREKCDSSEREMLLVGGIEGALSDVSVRRERYMIERDI